MEFKDYVEFFNKCREDRKAHRKSGIYAWVLNGEVVYVGQSRELYSRFYSHAEELAKVRPKKGAGNLKYNLLKKYASMIEFRELEYTDNLQHELTEAENKWIRHYRPIFNVNTPYGRQYFMGDQYDIDNFVEGWFTMDDLREKVIIQ